MQKNRRKIVFIIAVLFLCVGIIGIRGTKADSGWDTSYGGGSSSSSSSGSSGGSSSSGWSSSSSSRSGGYSSYGELSTGDKVISIFLVVIGILFGIASLLSDNQKQKPIREKYTLSKDEIRELDASLDIEEFKKMVYEYFVDIQNAWMNFDYDMLRSKLTDELYNQYEMQLETLKSKGQKNIMNDFNYIDCGITSIKINDDIETIDAQLKVSFRDYVVDSNNKVVRGNKKTIYNMVYILTFVRKLSNANNKCPKCGAPIENSSSNKCLYCRATIIINNNKFTMSKKVLLGQSSVRK